MDALLGIDVGTSSCKAAAFDLNGVVIAQSVKEYNVYYPHEGFAEQDADEWFAAVSAAVREVTAAVGAEKIAAVGIDGQSWSCIMCGEDRNALARTPIWIDTRASEECAFIRGTLGDEHIFSLCGNPVMPQYVTPKALWFKKHAPGLFGSTYKILQSNSYIAMKLTGVFSQDVSQGYGHFFWDIKNCRYDIDTARSLGLDINIFPDVYKCSEVIGTVTVGAAALTGLREGTPVVAGGLDAAAGTFGAGVYKDRMTQEQGGQAGGMSICCDTPVTHRSLIAGNHICEGLWLLQGGTVGGGAAVKWYSGVLGGAYGGSLAELDRAADESEAGAGGVIFLPYLNGERSPLWNENAKGVFYGMSYRTTKGELARAVMEGVAYSLRHNLECAAQCGVSPSRLYSVGGAAKSEFWTRLKCDVTGIPITVPDAANATALGAAMTAGIGIHAYKDAAAAVKAAVRFTAEYTPDESKREVYDRGYKLYREIGERLF